MCGVVAAEVRRRGQRRRPTTAMTTAAGPGDPDVAHLTSADFDHVYEMGAMRVRDAGALVGR